MKRLYRTVYLEKQAKERPLTSRILERLPDCPVVVVENYKQAFNRPGQNQRLQKQSPALILAVHPDPPIYPGPAICQNFGQTRFVYTSFVQNCPFDCSYCFLQGLYPSSDQLIFVNPEDWAHRLAQMAEDGPLYAALSHDSDLLALQARFPLLDPLGDDWPQSPSIQAEIRTKSSWTGYYTQHQPRQNLIFAFSLAPQPLIDLYEPVTPTLRSRLLAARTALDHGHPVRLCFDPVFADPVYDHLYETFFTEVFQTLDPTRLHDASYGFLRLPRTLYRRIIQRRPNAPFLAESLQLSGETVGYAAVRQAEIRQRHLNWLSSYLRKDQIFLVEDTEASCQFADQTP